MKKLTYLAAAVTIIAGLAACTPNKSSITAEEKALINVPTDTMKVYSIDNPQDAKVLRAKSIDFTTDDLKSDDFKKLSEKMMNTVKSEEHAGVGIAAPQVGLNRRMVIVCRYDKPGKPFEVFANIKIEKYLGVMQEGPEGCLSVPGKRGLVPRYEGVQISYVDLNTYERVTETVVDYTAVIFQHECDHLDGIIYTDKATLVSDR